jgi:hypothetical protein
LRSAQLPLLQLNKRWDAKKMSLDFQCERRAFAVEPYLTPKLVAHLSYAFRRVQSILTPVAPPAQGFGGVTVTAWIPSPSQNTRLPPIRERRDNDTVVKASQSITSHFISTRVLKKPKHPA